MDINAAFPSKYLKAADFHAPVAVTITHLTMEDVDGSPKPCVFFQGITNEEGQPKGLILNKTNGNEISYMHGTETDGWAGKQIEVYPTETDYQGKRVPCIRVRRPGAAASSPQQGVQQAVLDDVPDNFDQSQPPAHDGFQGR